MTSSTPRSPPRRRSSPPAIAQLDGVLAKLESGIIPGGMIEGVDEDTSIEDARAALSSARSQALSAFAERREPA